MCYNINDHSTSQSLLHIPITSLFLTQEKITLGKDTIKNFDKVFEYPDQIFEIFWPRINSIWPLLNEDKIDFEKDESTKILRDAINWLYTLDDLKDRLPEFTEDYEVFEHDTDAADFDYDKRLLLNGINSGTKSYLADLTRERENLALKLIK